MMYLLGLISLSFYRGPFLALQVRPWARHALADVIRDLADNAGNNLECELAPPRAFMIVLLATASADVIPVIWDKTVASTWVSWHNGKSSTESASDLIEEETFLVFWLSYVLHWLWYTQLHQKLKFSLWLPAQDRLKINAVSLLEAWPTALIVKDTTVHRRILYKFWQIALMLGSLGEIYSYF